MTNQVFHGDGFTVEPAGMHSLRYNENGKSALVHGETTILDASNLETGFVIYSDSVGWEESQELEEQDRIRILSGVSKALRAWGVSFEIE
ncbi:MAG: hypothetical protein SFV81_06430 [Pirellulaceae bacterium]|nr:hypothetical protein [Pirellulaceae bacterium]